MAASSCSFRFWILSARIVQNVNKTKRLLFNQYANFLEKIPSRTLSTQQIGVSHMLNGKSVIQPYSFSRGTMLRQIMRQQIKTGGVFTSGWSSMAFKHTILSGHDLVPALCRGINMVSKKGKRKTCKAVAKRFIRTGKGKLKRWRCGKHHNQSKKSSRRKRFLRKPTYVSKTQLKTLNKMLNRW